MLDVRSLAKTFRAAARPLFQNVSLALAAGECAAIMGESGSGKSTLLNIIAGLDAPDAGDVVIEDVSITKLEEPARTLLRRQRIGFVFQAFHLLPHLDVADNIALPLTLNRVNDVETNSRVAELLQAVGLEDRAHAFPRELSGGEMQRVAVARALAHRPAIVLADEPTGNLDADSAEQVLDLLHNQARQERAALVLVTHSLTAARAMDRVLQLKPDGLRLLI